MSEPQVPLASLDLLRQLTDRHVIDQLLAAPTMTRAEIATATGISKPTISESVRRLELAGVITESGQPVTRRRGPAGTNYALRGDVGVALALCAGPDGLVAETFDVRGTRLARRERAIQSPITGAQLGPLLAELAAEAVGATTGPVLATALSVAGPVDRETGRLVHLPHSPFLVDELDSRGVLTPIVGDLIVDNDVNWASVAEFHAGVAADLDDFCYLHLGYGIGGAVIRGGELVRGSGGLAGEAAHVLTIGPGGRAMSLVECFATLELLRPGTDAIDVDRVARSLRGANAAHRRERAAIVEAVAGVVASMAALLNPAGVVIGGPWSTAADFAERLEQRVRELAVPTVALRVAELGTSAPLIGARLAAVRVAQTSLLGPLAKELAG